MNRGAFNTSVRFQSTVVGRLGINLASYQLHYHLEAHLSLLSALSTMYVAVTIMDLKFSIHFYEKSRQIGSACA